jgi:hypothetical protein
MSRHDESSYIPTINKGLAARRTYVIAFIMTGRVLAPIL